MRVALDATPLALATGGLTRYTAELSRALAATFPEDEFLLLSDQSFRAPDGPPNLKAGPGPRTSWDRRWWTLGLNRELSRARADVFHGTNFEVPCLPAHPSVVTVHDLSPWCEAAWQTGSGRVRDRAPYLLGLGMATMVITVSEAVRQETLERFRIPAGRVVSVPLAASPHFRPVPPEGQPVRPYFLYVGALEPRKNLDMLIDAWRETGREFGVDLVLAGRAREAARLPAPEPGLRVPGEVPDQDLPALYSGAIAVVYPSLYEGFGLPVLEAMQCGAAVIASRIPAIGETAGGAAMEIDPADGRAWAELLRFAAENPERLEPWRKASRARAAKFSWAATARCTREVYEQAVERFHQG
jgi:glycosyltransferase involved in cell wall biosynthesis